MERETTIDGVRLHYDVSGSGAPLVLMHGWGCQGSTVASIAAVASQSHTVYNIDLPGHGKSSEPPATWGVEEYTRLIEHFVDSLGIESPVLVGHSFGGRIALLYASRHPEVRRMVLVDAAGIKPRRSLRYYAKVYSFKIYKRLLPLIVGRRKADELIECARNRAGSADYAQASPRMRAILSRVVNEDLKHVMPAIKASTLLVWGENDTATPISDARYMECHIADAGLVAFPGCGHYSFLDNPGQFAAVLQSFLKS